MDQNLNKKDVKSGDGGGIADGKITRVYTPKDYEWKRNLPYGLANGVPHFPG